MSNFLETFGVKQGGFENSFKYENTKSKKFKIIETTKQHITPAIDIYINSLQSASNKTIQSRVLLYDSYLTTLMVDDVVQSLLDKRLDNITNKSIQIYQNDKHLEDMDYFFESPKFQQFLKDMIMTKFWGFQLFEFDEFVFDEKKWFDYKVIPHKHVNPYRKEVLKKQFDREGISFEKRNDYLFIGDEDDLGLLSKITLLSLYNRLGMFGYSKYLDLASENFQTIKTRGYVDDEDINHIQKQLATRGSGGNIQVPDGIDFDLINQSSSQQNQLFENYMERVKDRMATLILGQTMTTSDGSSRSQAEVHQSEQSKKYSSDELFVLNVLNFEFRDYLPLWFKDINTNGMEFRLVPSTAEEIRNKLQTYKLLKELGMQFSEDQLREAFSTLL